MTPEQNKIYVIVSKLRVGENLSEDEIEILNDWLKDSLNNELLKDIEKDETLLEGLEIFYNYPLSEGKEKLENALKPVKTTNMWPRYLVAASVISIIAFGSYLLFLTNHPKKTGNKRELATQEIKPGSYKAKLQLSDGRTIVLDSAALGELTKQGNTTIINKDHQLVYNSTGDENKVLYNSLSTERGEAFSATLSDGTVCYLNSGSTITYPVSFIGNERDVSIKGEVYFDVVKSEKPFIVSILTEENQDMGKVAVKGTQFNINAYTDELAVRTTLEDGKIEYKKDNHVALLSPGQQAVLAGDNVSINYNVNVAKLTAWRRNDFYFSGDDIKTVMRQIARWYNVEVAYEGSITTETFSGMISRQKNLSEVLAILEGAQVHFKVEGRKITVLP